MKISISYPPLESEKGIPLLGQNRQFQWFNDPTYIYPIVPAYAATLLKENGFDVIWDDGIAEEKSYKQWLNDIKQEKPDVIVIETKTPVVKRHWNIINELKKQTTLVRRKFYEGGDHHRSPTTDNWSPITVLMGDHVTALPKESMQNCNVDFIITGGDYDFLLLNICQYLIQEKSSLQQAIDNKQENNQQLSTSTSPPITDNSSLITKLPPGIWYRKNDQIKNTGKPELNHDLDTLPIIDRNLTKWHLYSEKNGNYKYLPGTYTMAARDCWWGKCTFCSWTTIFPGNKYRAISPQKMLDEIDILINDYGVKEIMDDSGSFPVGKWLIEFCNGMIERGYNKRVIIDCNMRFGVLKEEDYKLMGKAGFRFILFGLESANQNTLDKIDKNLKPEQIEDGVKWAKKAGLDPHITVMMGYPWETKEDATKSIELAKYLFKRGYIDTLQATIVIPYPGTPLFKDCKNNGWLLTEDWDRFDMREAVMQSQMTEKDIKELTQSLYKSFVSPQYIIRKLLAVRSVKDLKFLFRAGKKLLGHLTDFKTKR
jgi:anaerobic magnesium-protoporphyrin IX monomethyl ester cyclase